MKTDPKKLTDDALLVTAQIVSNACVRVACRQFGHQVWNVLHNWREELAKECLNRGYTWMNIRQHDVK